ncbi:hypothetical protein SAMN02745181_0559 [Rubritalea squalenifaciens DSM 18772]|uniref:Uncharacterized protein n=1 Tax=Rubritalea squalenifaciens DSM 18772 TaxID=1123071 RepID=A0A1M6CTG6_9BACT|nr:hypothetical protein [Rubritalea squalenifaciens]SHI64161.1 hypothetical protein SAMN02745181_0559 [Rubritalea squalenifaciens DSM 18772]
MICRSLIKLVSLTWLLSMASLMTVAAEEEKKFPEWWFCVAYTLRDADEREARPSPGGDPFAGDKPWIPSGLVRQRDVVDVAALASRTLAQKTLTKESAQKVIKATFEGGGRHPVMDCYEPHHCFVFYTFLGEPVACIEVCLTCNNVKTNLGKNLFDQGRLSVDLVTLARIIHEAGLPLTPYKSLQEYENQAQKKIDAAEKR